jgi:hypothetical protein
MDDQDETDRKIATLIDEIMDKKKSKEEMSEMISGIVADLAKIAETDEKTQSKNITIAATSDGRVSPSSHPLWPIDLFFNSHFTIHRLFGLVYLVLYCYAWKEYLYNYEEFQNSFIIWGLPLNGLLQAITASYYFRFLPKKTKDPGYDSDKGPLSHAFVKENIFFSGLLLWQFVYYSKKLGPHNYYSQRALTEKSDASRSMYVIIEHFFVFLPYFIRPLFPKTSFRDYIHSTTNKSQKNAWFTQITKIFYLWAKWYIGFFLNYLRYLNLVNDEHRREIYRLLLFSAFATTISLFLHTLKFKGYIGPKTSFVTYMVSYLVSSLLHQDFGNFVDAPLTFPCF